ncbi:hypothetical protein [Natrinema pallidum]|nr:hypothetical protein [Natrinema pallidum]
MKDDQREMPLRNPSAAFFSIVLGGYVGGLTLCAASRVLGAAYTALWPVAIGACAGLVAASQCYTRPTPAATLVRTRLHALPFAVVVLGAVVWVLTTIGVRGVEPWLRTWVVEIVVFSFGGAVVYLISINRHVTALHEREPVVAEWRTRTGSRTRSDGSSSPHQRPTNDPPPLRGGLPPTVGSSPT